MIVTSGIWFARAIIYWPVFQRSIWLYAIVCALCACLNVWFFQISRTQAPKASLCNPCVTKYEEFVRGLKSEKLELKSQAATDLEKLTL